MKKILSALLILVMIFSVSCPAFAAKDSLNKMDAWKIDDTFFATDTVETLKEKGISFSESDRITFNDGNVVITRDNVVTLNHDLGGNYTFESEFKSSNTNQHYVTFNKNGKSYYKLILLYGGNDPGTLQLSKVTDGGEAVVLKEVKTVQPATAWWANHAFTVKVSQEIVDGGINIKVNLYSHRTKETVALEYTDTNNAFVSGAAQVVLPYATNTLYTLKAYSTPYSEPTLVNKVIADYDGFKGHTLESLTQRGFKFTNLSYMDISHTQMKLLNNHGNITFNEPGKNVIEGSYNAKFDFGWSWNKHSVSFNRNGSDYYHILKGSEAVNGATQHFVRLNKVTASGTTTLAENTYTASPFADTYSARNYEIEVNKEVSPAQITVKITVDGVEHTLTCADAAPLADGKIFIDCEYAGYPTLYNFFCTKKEYVGGSNVNGDAGLYTKAITYNRKIGATDSVDGLLNEGINLAYNKKAETITFGSTGACFNGVTDNAFVMYKPGNLTSDSYVFTTKHVTNNQRQSELRFNVSEDKKTYYQFKFVITNDYQNPNSHIELYKVVNGASTLLASNEDADRGAAGAGGTTTLKVIVNKTASGNEITVSATGSRHGGTDSLSYTDSTSPLVAGDFLLGFGSYGGAETFKELSYSIDKLITLNDDLFFYVNGAYATGYSKGLIEIEAPIKRVGNYVVVASLYEDYEMTSVKTLTPDQFNSGKVTLFDTTQSTAKDAYVKVFIFDSEDTLNNLTKVYELN